MDSSTLVTAVAGVLGAVLAAAATYALQRRKASDRDAFSLWRTAFDRPAFKDPFLWQSDQEAYRRAITNTIRAVNTGVLVDSHGNELDRKKGKAQLRSAASRELMDSVERRLNSIRNLIPNESEPYVEDVSTKIDAERDETVRLMNTIWRKLKISELPPPTIPS